MGPYGTLGSYIFPFYSQAYCAIGTIFSMMLAGCMSKTRSRNGPSYNTPAKFVDGGFSLDFHPHYVGEKRKINQSESSY